MIVVMNIIHILLNIFQYGFIRTSCMPMDLSNFMGITSVLMIPSLGIVIFLLVCIVLQESITQTMNSELIFFLLSCRRWRLTLKLLSYGVFEVKTDANGSKNLAYKTLINSEQVLTRRDFAYCHFVLIGVNLYHICTSKGGSHGSTTFQQCATVFNSVQ